MNFEEKLKNYVSRIQDIKENILTEEATKTSLIMPFFQLLGYDVFNPKEFTPEYIADVGIKKGEKVDYAIVLNDEVSILIEAKAITEKLEKHDSQLFRYFGTSKAKFAILTNGIVYKFYTDLEKENVMDVTPFLEVNLENLQDSDIIQLKKFEKDSFNIDEIFSTANDLKYLNLIKKVIKEEFSNPSDDFVKLILNHEIYAGAKTNTIVEKYRPLVKKSISMYFNDLINTKLQSVMTNNEYEKTEIEETEMDNGIITTDEELQAYYTVKSILTEYCQSKRIHYKDTTRYFSILLDNKVTQWICRIYLKESVKYITIPDENKKEIRYDIKSIDDIYLLKKEIIKGLNVYEKNIDKVTS